MTGVQTCALRSPGVYLFYGENDLPLYIGKSVNIRARVLSHFSRDHASNKEMRISQEIKHIEWITTAGEFSALLLESQLVKERQPLHNRRLRNERQLCSWKLNENPQAKNLLELVLEPQINPAQLGQLHGTFKTKRQALETLRMIAIAHQLCPRYLGLEPAKASACFASQIKQCKGVCCGRETPELHYIRLQQALIAHCLKPWPHKGKIGIREQSHENNQTQMHVFEHWTYLGMVENDQDLTEIMQARHEFKFDLDTYKLLIKVLGNVKTNIINL